MLIKLPKYPTTIEIEEAIKQWVNLLAAEDYAAAFQATLHDPYYKWTPGLMKSVINGYGFPYENDGSLKHKVTRWEELVGNKRRYAQEITLFGNIRQHTNPVFYWIGDVEYDLPINNEWSDVTATFKILQAENFSALELNEIHVM